MSQSAKVFLIFSVVVSTFASMSHAQSSNAQQQDEHTTQDLPSGEQSKLAQEAGKPAIKKPADSDIQLNQELIKELAEMAKLDQIAASVPQGKYKEMSGEEWKAFKRTTFETHHKRLAEMFETHGFVGFDVAGKSGSNHFWLMVQHCDHAPEFQLQVLEQMKREVEQANADSARFAMLVDRVNLNTGKKQIYGTQVGYDLETCQAFARELANPESVNARRTSVGLPTLEEYLNGMSETHFRMNKEHYLKLGIKEPTLYSKD